MLGRVLVALVVMVCGTTGAAQAGRGQHNGFARGGVVVVVRPHPGPVVVSPVARPPAVVLLPPPHVLFPRPFPPTSVVAPPVLTQPVVPVLRPPGMIPPPQQLLPRPVDRPILLRPGASGVERHSWGAWTREPWWFKSGALGSSWTGPVVLSGQSVTVHGGSATTTNATGTTTIASWRQTSGWARGGEAWPSPSMPAWQAPRFSEGRRW